MRYRSPAEIGRQLGKSPRAVVREILKGNLSAVKIGRTFRVAEVDLASYLERSRVRPRTERHSDQLQAAVASHRHAAAERRCEQAGL